MRRDIESILRAKGYAPAIVVLNAYKPGLSWLREVVQPALEAIPRLERVRIAFREFASDRPALEMKSRWLQELYPGPDLLAAAGTYDLVLGSRFVSGGRDADRGIHRRFITLCVRTFIRRLYRLPVRDVSSGFRLFRREVLEAVDLNDLISVGQSVVLEILRKVSLLGFRIGEVPIVFVDRTRGQTKLNFLALLETLLMAVQFKKRYTRKTVKAVR